jgi:hypothetical protein
MSISNAFHKDKNGHMFHYMFLFITNTCFIDLYVCIIVYIAISFFYIEILYPPLFFIVNYYQLTKVDLHIVIEGECFEIDVDYVND